MIFGEMEASIDDAEKDDNNTIKKRKKLESLVKKAKKKKHGISPEESNVPSSDDGYVTAADDKRNLGFTLVGKQSSTRLPTNVKHYLPDWLRNPIIISSDLKSCSYPIENIENLDTLLVYNLINEGITHLFPVQYEVIPWVLNDVVKNRLSFSLSRRPRDICVSAPTGSGKTLAYAIPIIQCLKKRFVPKIRALIVAPVQELVLQVTSVLKTLSKGTNLKIEACIGGRTPLPLEQAKLVKRVNENSDEFESLIDILVITPGRLVEHLENTQGFDLHSLRYLVMDEADRMFENVQNEWLYHLEKHLSSGLVKGPPQLSGETSIYRRLFPQRLLFSATLSQDPEKLKRLNLFQPILFSTVVSLEASKNADVTEDYIGSFTTPQGLKEKFTTVETIRKPLVMCELVERGWKGILCFTKSAVDAHKLCKLLSILNPNFKIKEISSLLPNDQREEILKDFSSGAIDMLISSDIMARGIDICQVKYVVSYDPPKHIKSYIHRVGRTGRAGSKGTAMTILTPAQLPAFNQMLHDVNKHDVKEMVIETECLDKWKPKYKIALQELKVILQKEEQSLDQATKMKNSTLSKTKKKRTKKKKKNASTNSK